jgi:hypothetical protein
MSLFTSINAKKKNSTVGHKDWRFYVIALGFILSTLGAIGNVSNGEISFVLVGFITYAALSANICFRILRGKFVSDLVINVTLLFAIVIVVFFIFVIFVLYTLMSFFSTIKF